MMKRRAPWLALSLVIGCLGSHAHAGPTIVDGAEVQDWASVTEQLNAGVDVNALQPDGSTALHWAAYHDRGGAVAELIEAGAKADVTNRYGITPLLLACENGNGSVVRALLDAGADANDRRKGGETALMVAARTGRPDAMRELIASGAKVDATDRAGQTPLMWAAAEGHAEAVGLLIESGAEIGTRLESGFTALLFAAREGRREALRTLLEAGADPRQAIEAEGKTSGRDAPNGTSAVILAVENGHFELAIDLVKAGADPNDARRGFTALHALTWVRKPSRGDNLAGQPPPEIRGRLNSLAFARALVEAGARVDQPLTRQVSAVGKLAFGGVTPFLLACKTADLPYMKLLVELGADPKQVTWNGTTPLMACAGLGCFAPDEEAGTEDECLAASKWLLSIGADVNAVNDQGDTAMHGAAYKSLPKLVDWLDANGADVAAWSQPNHKKWTPLLIAQGFRFGNFKPSVPTIDAISRVMRAHGVEPPPAPDREAFKKKGYD